MFNFMVLKLTPTASRKHLINSCVKSSLEAQTLTGDILPIKCDVDNVLFRQFGCEGVSCDVHCNLIAFHGNSNATLCHTHIHVTKTGFAWVHCTCNIHDYQFYHSTRKAKHKLTLLLCHTHMHTSLLRITLTQHWPLSSNQQWLEPRPLNSLRLNVEQTSCADSIHHRR